MVDRQLSEDLIKFNLDDIFDLTFDLDSLNSVDKMSTKWLDELASSIAVENIEISARNATIQKDRTLDALIETDGVTNQQNPEHVDIEKNDNPEPPLNHVEITILGDAVQNDAVFSSSVVNLQKENNVSDLLQIQNSDSIMKNTESRICLSKEELSVLEREFQICHYPDRFTRKKLALTLNLSRLAVSEWFTNRRIKLRKQTSGYVEENDENKKINFNKNQLAMLECEFKKSQYPDCLTRQKLSLMLGLKDVTVKNWFHCRRVKMRKLMEEAQLAALQMKSNTLSVSKTLFQRKYLARKTDTNNNQRIPVEHRLKKQKIYNNVVGQSVPSRILINQQIREPQAESSSSQSQIENRFPSREPTGRKRTRTNFCNSQLSVLEHRFIKCKYPDSDTISQLASTINVTKDKVKNWFRNRRFKQKYLEKNNQTMQPQMETVDLPRMKNYSTQRSKTTSSRKSQLGVLEHEFEKCPHPDLIKLCQLASKTKCTNSQVRRWFTYRRAKQRLLEKCAKKMAQTKREQFSFSLPSKTFELNCHPKETELNSSQLAILEREFSICQYPQSHECEKLGLVLNLTYPLVSQWFENRRTKERQISGQNQSSTLRTDTPRLSRQIPDFNENELAVLEDEFKKCRYPDYHTCMNLASIVNVPYIRICEWFMDRRAKEKTPETPLLFGTSRPQYSFRKIHFTKDQVAILEQAFAQYQYLDVDTTYSLAEKINVSYERVRTWFTNRRTKQKQLEKYGQRLQSQTESNRFLPSTEPHLKDAQPHERQIQQFQNHQNLPMFGVYCCNNAFCNKIQQMEVYPQNLRFGWYSSMWPIFMPQSYGVSPFPLIQENTLYVNPASTSAQHVYLHSYNAPMPNYSFLAEL